MIKHDEFGVPTLESIPSMLVSELFTQNHPRLETSIGRKLTETEQSAVESMESEHASYVSTRWYLKSLLPVNGPNHFHAIGDEAASAAIFVSPKTGKTTALSYSSESHNGPSYVCAHPGAATGTGGMQRDQGANTGTRVDKLFEARRQGHPDFNSFNDPIAQHTRETTKGIAEYGNAKGIPHGDGSIKYHPGFAGNNLVNVMGITISEKNTLSSNKVPKFGTPDDYFLIYVGKASDTTGIGGTKFASKPIDMTNIDLNEKAVQDPDPHLQEVVFRGLEMITQKSIDEGWSHNISKKDMGAAGLLCSTIEQCRDNVGMIINGNLVPANSPRSATELLEAETQERFMLIVHKDHVDDVLDIFNSKLGLPYVNMGAKAAVIGRCNDSGRYVFVKNNVVEVDFPWRDLVEVPVINKPIKERFHKKRAAKLQPQLDIAIGNALRSVHFKSDNFVHDHYDKHVRSTKIVGRGQGCATLHTHPLLEGKIGYSAIFDSHPMIGIIDPKLQAEDSFLRAAYKLSTVGCSVIGVTNNANYGRTDIPEEMWEFVKGQEGVARACYSWNLEPEYISEIMKDPQITQKFLDDKRRHVTINSGNASMNKANANTKTAIPPTTILGVVGWTNKPDAYSTWDLKPEISDLYLIGARQKHLGATGYMFNNFGPNEIGDKPYIIDYDASMNEVNALIKSVRRNYVLSSNAIEEDGLLVAVSEMVANTKDNVGVNLNLYSTMGSTRLNDEQKLFSENPGIVVQVSNSYSTNFEGLCKSNNSECYLIGSVEPATTYGHLRIHTGLHAIDYDQFELQNNYFNKIHSKLGDFL